MGIELRDAKLKEAKLSKENERFGVFILFLPCLQQMKDKSYAT
jgi:hypothetical protein